MPKIIRPRQEFPTPLFKVTVALLVAAAVALGTWLGTRGGDRRTDPPVLVPWRQVGDLALGESKSRVLEEYGSYHVVQAYDDTVEAYYRLHRSKVYVTFYGDRVSALGFRTPYYRTSNGFGVGSTVHRLQGFLYNPRLREDPCGCWVKIGNGAESLAVGGDNFLKPWYFVYVDRRGRVTGFYWDRRFVD
jgi:hypothetical protein